MSPSEFDLRSALRDGEGDGDGGVEVEALIATGDARRAQRRVQLLSSAAVVVFVAAAGTGGALLWGNGGNGHDSGGGSQQQLSRVSAANGGAAHPSSSEPAASGAASGCPEALPRHLLPGGAGPGRSGSAAPLFTKPVASIVVCSYGITKQSVHQTPPIPARLVLTGSQAQQLRSSLENAARTPPRTACPAILRADQRELAIIGVTAGGTRLTSITTTLNAVPCQVTVTNGTALRYGWSPPPALTEILRSLTPRLRTGSGTTDPRQPSNYPSAPNPTRHGSPIHS